MRKLLVRCSEASELTGIGTKRLYALAAQDAIPGVIRIGRSVRFSLPVLLRWLDANGVKSDIHHDYHDHIAGNSTDRD